MPSGFQSPCGRYWLPSSTVAGMTGQIRPRAPVAKARGEPAQTNAEPPHGSHLESQRGRAGGAAHWPCALNLSRTMTGAELNLWAGEGLAHRQPFLARSDMAFQTGAARVLSPQARQPSRWWPLDSSWPALGRAAASCHGVDAILARRGPEIGASARPVANSCHLESGNGAPIGIPP